MTSNSFGLSLVGAAFHEQVDSHYVDLPYHNRAHADQVTLEAFALADYCEENGQAPNRLVLLLASQYHDADFHEDFDSSRFSSKERYSAYIASQELSKKLVPSDTIRQVTSCIRSTERGVPCESLEAKIIRRADLANLAGPLGGMLLSSLNLFNECRQISGIQTGWIDFLRGTRANIQDYLSEDVSFGDFDRSRDNSLWLQAVEKNLQTIETIILDPAELATKACTQLIEHFKRESN